MPFVKNMKQIELTSKLGLAIIGMVAVGAILIPTYAVPTIKSADIFDGEVKTADLANGAVTNPKLANDAVTSGKIKNGEVKAEDIAAGVISSGGIQDTHRVEGDVITIPAGTVGGTDAGCPAGEILTGGGFFGTAGIQVLSSVPLENDVTGELDEWRVIAKADDSFDGSVKPWAVCGVPSP